MELFAKLMERKSKHKLFQEIRNLVSLMKLLELMLVEVESIHLEIKIKIRLAL